MRRFLLAAVLLCQTAASAAAACHTRKDDFAALYCLIPSFQKADRALNFAFARLNSSLAVPRQKALRADELRWIRRRDRNCTRHEAGGFYVDLACATKMSRAHAGFLESRYRTCVKSRCSDLDFYNTQDLERRDRGPTLVGYPAISKYHGPDAGYIAVYTHDPANTLYAIGNGMYVAGFIRLRGHYDGRVFRPEGYGSRDISADPDFKKLTDSLFPGHPGGTWAGGDTGGFVKN